MSTICIASSVNEKVTFAGRLVKAGRFSCEYSRLAPLMYVEPSGKRIETLQLTALFVRLGYFGKSMRLTLKDSCTIRLFESTNPTVNICGVPCGKFIFTP